MATLRDVALRAKVSVSTVSRVINNEPRVRKKTREKVEAAILELSYLPNRTAQRLRSLNAKNKLIGLVLPDIQNPFYVDVVRGVEECAYEYNFAVMIGNFAQDERKEKMYLDVLQSESVDGLIVAPSHGRDQHIARVMENGYTVVCIDRGLIGMEVDIVKVNNEAGAFGAIEYLIGLGHTRIAHITGHPDIPTTAERVAGYERAMAKYGVEVDPELIKSSNSDYQSGASLMRELLELPNPPTAVFTANNLLTLGALKTIHESERTIPDDISVVGFDDMYWSMSLNPPLTAVRQSGYEIGRKAAELLLKRLADPHRPAVSLVLDTELIVRQSCKPR
ncbi:MAG TPA: LacI family DNA-binding transcriptional regulator [Woeseiaceae bacterium]|nr:LacI family DNA-binding transcriptional regulator [Woeseiaceae bacterium]